MVILYIFAIVFALVYFILALVQLGRSIWAKFDHCYWDQDAHPSLDAQIVNVDSEKVEYEKNNAKFKTTITFSDGFRFVTHRTERTQHFFTYDISTDMGDILPRAIDAHKDAVNKKLK